MRGVSCESMVRHYACGGMALRVRRDSTTRAAGWHYACGEMALRVRRDGTTGATG